MALFKVKILVLGPTESGKSVLCNFLSEATEISSDYYHPTQGVRTTSVDVELWDCSGDRRFETCWPAFTKDTNGIMFVFNSDRPNHDKELDELLSYFASEAAVGCGNCLCIFHYKPDATDRVRSELQVLKC